MNYEELGRRVRNLAWRSDEQLGREVELLVRLEGPASKHYAVLGAEVAQLWQRAATEEWSTAKLGRKVDRLMTCGVERLWQRAATEDWGPERLRLALQMNAEWQRSG